MSRKEVGAGGNVREVKRSCKTTRTGLQPSLSITPFNNSIQRLAPGDAKIIKTIHDKERFCATDATLAHFYACSLAEAKLDATTTSL